MRTQLRAVSFFLGLVAGCSDDGADSMPDAGPARADAALDAAIGGDDFRVGLVHEFEPIEIASGLEDEGLCQSWTLDNEEPIFVRGVRAENQGGFHHSNWVFTPDTSFVGDDGTWRCDERGFNQAVAGLSGGVFFAQSTQALRETQRFGEGVAFRLPAHARVIGQLHVLNVIGETMSSRIRFEVETLEADQVEVELGPAAYTNLGLEIAPAGRTAARMQADVPAADFRLHYVLPHFHALGTGMRIDVVGGPRDGEEIFASDGKYGQALGGTFDPPLALEGVQALGITCDYDNPTEATVGYGIGDQEMCVVLLYTDSGFKSGGLSNANTATEMRDGVFHTEATITTFDVALPQ